MIVDLLPFSSQGSKLDLDPASLLVAVICVLLYTGCSPRACLAQPSSIENAPSEREYSVESTFDQWSTPTHGMAIDHVEVVAMLTDKGKLPKLTLNFEGLPNIPLSKSSEKLSKDTYLFRWVLKPGGNQGSALWLKALDSPAYVAKIRVFSMALPQPAPSIDRKSFKIPLQVVEERRQLRNAGKYFPPNYLLPPAPEWTARGKRHVPLDAETKSAPQD